MEKILQNAKGLIDEINEAKCETEAEIKQLRALLAWIEEEYVKALGAKMERIKKSDISI